MESVDRISNLAEALIIRAPPFLIVGDVTRRWWYAGVEIFHPLRFKFGRMISHLSTGILEVLRESLIFGAGQC